MQQNESVRLDAMAVALRRVVIPVIISTRVSFAMQWFLFGFAALDEKESQADGPRDAVLDESLSDRDGGEAKFSNSLSLEASVSCPAGIEIAAFCVKESIQLGQGCLISSHVDVELMKVNIKRYDRVQRRRNEERLLHCRSPA